jgi:hypothetical protein
MPSTSDARVLVVVEDDCIDRIERVASALRAAGMRVENVLESLGTVSGTIDAHRVRALRAVEGVAEVELDRTFGVLGSATR